MERPLGVYHFAVVILECPAAVEIEQRLDESLAERRVADDDRAVMVLQRTSDDLRRGGRVLVRQNDERDVRSNGFSRAKYICGSVFRPRTLAISCP